MEQEKKEETKKIKSQQRLPEVLFGMKVSDILERIPGRTKERKLFILLGLTSGLTEQEIADSVGFKSHSWISEIKTENLDLLDELTMKAELARKAGRLRIAYKAIRFRNLTGFPLSKKDTLEWLEYIRREVEGDKSGITVPIQVNILQQERKVIDHLEKLSPKRRERIFKVLDGLAREPHKGDKK